VHLPAKYRAARQGAEVNDVFFRSLVRTSLDLGHLPLVQDGLLKAQQRFQTHAQASAMDAEKCRYALLTGLTLAACKDHCSMQHTPS
jgi:hypothetical protein